MFRTLSLFVVVLVTVLFVTAAARADEPSADPFAESAAASPTSPSCCRLSSERIHKRRCCAPMMAGPVSRADRRIQKALRSPTELDFNETPLRDVIDHLKSLHGIEIQIDAKALDDVGLGTGETITKTLRGITLQSALKLILRDLDLTYIIADEVLLITTPEEAECRLTVMLYPVAKLLAEGDRVGGFPAGGETLISLITATIQPTTWEAVGGPGSIQGVSFRGADMVVISQTAQVHDEVTKLLHSLCRVAKVPGNR